MRCLNNKWNKIFSVAKKLFLKYWYENVSVDKIVKKSWVAKGTFYLYYKSKKELYSIINEDVEKCKNKFTKILLNDIDNSKERIMLKFLISIKYLLLINDYEIGIDDEENFTIDFVCDNKIEQISEMVKDMILNIFPQIEKELLMTITRFVMMFINFYKFKENYKTEEEFFREALRIAYIFYLWISNIKKEEIDNLNFKKLYNKVNNINFNF